MRARFLLAARRDPDRAVTAPCSTADDNAAVRYRPKRTEIPFLPTTRSTPARILVLDGDEQVHELICELLEELGHAVTGFDDPEEALEALARGHHDLLVTCIRLRKFNGMEVLRRLRQVAPNLPAVVCSAIRDEERNQEATALGAVARLAKPFRIGDRRDAIAAGLADKTWRPCLPPRLRGTTGASPKSE